MLYVYKQKLRLLDHIKELSYQLDPNNNSVIVIIFSYLVHFGFYEIMQHIGGGLTYDATNLSRLGWFYQVKEIPQRNLFYKEDSHVRYFRGSRHRCYLN